MRGGVELERIEKIGIDTAQQHVDPLETRNGADMDAVAADSEVVALKTSGVSLYQMTIPIVVFTALACLATFAIAIWVRPWSNGALRQQMFEIVKSRISAGFKEKVFNVDFPGLVIYIEEIEPGGGTLKGILISDTRNPQNRNTVIAKIGLLVPNEDAKTMTLRLLDGTKVPPSKIERTVTRLMQAGRVTVVLPQIGEHRVQRDPVGQIDNVRAALLIGKSPSQGSQTEHAVRSAHMGVTFGHEWNAVAGRCEESWP
jgi:lipopolysaccharide export LptBFGC system permease protein LptF